MEGDIFELKKVIESAEKEQESLLKKFKSVQKYVRLMQDKYLARNSIELLKDEMEEKCNQCNLFEKGCFFGYDSCPFDYKQFAK